MEFTKMHGLGNDFIVTRDIEGADLAEMAARLCKRRVSVGADGLIAVCPSSIADIRMRIFNADGSEAEMCGNGIRCFARYVYEQHLVERPDMSVETLAGIMRPQVVLENGKVRAIRVDMGKPDFSAQSVPVLTDTPLDFVLDASGTQVRASSVLMGVPHTVILDGPDDEEGISALGPRIESASVFPRKTNVDFVAIEAPDVLRVRTWERGAGRTMACGTGSCASAVVTHAKGLTGPKVTVVLDAGTLEIEIAPDGTVLMTGPAEHVYTARTAKEA